jgi:drug/metabolite transporter (DMT)-like permease
MTKHLSPSASGAEYTDCTDCTTSYQIQMPSSPNTSLLDRLGIALSGLCVLHCLVLPFVMPLLTFAVFQEESPLTHIILAVLVLPTAIFTSLRGYKHHRNSTVVALLLGGATMVACALLLGEHLSNETVEAGVTTAGSVLLIAGHWQNHKQCACEAH